MHDILILSFLNITFSVIMIREKDDLRLEGAVLLYTLPCTHLLFSIPRADTPTCPSILCDGRRMTDVYIFHSTF